LYLSSKILNDVDIEPMQPLFCYQENTVNQDFHFIKNIEVQQSEIFSNSSKILSKLVRHLSDNFPGHQF
jgi:hypothetical protein